jgi:hypothetical protein
MRSGTKELPSKPDMEDAIETKKPSCGLMVEIKQHDRFRGDPFEQAYHDEIAANDSSILELIDEEIVLTVDRDDELIAFLFSELFQTLYSEEIVSDVLEAFRLWSYHQAFPDLATTAGMICMGSSCVRIRSSA